MLTLSVFSFFFFFNDTATTEIYTLSLHDALPISSPCTSAILVSVGLKKLWQRGYCTSMHSFARSEEHTSELQSRLHLVCRLLLEKKKKMTTTLIHHTTVQTTLRITSKR